QMIAFDEPERLQGLQRILGAAAKQTGSTLPCQRAVEPWTGRIALADGQAVAVDNLDVQHITGVPAGCNRGLASKLEVARQCGAKPRHVCILLKSVIPPHHLLTDPTGYGERDFAVALTSGRRLEFSDTLLEISAA